MFNWFRDRNYQEEADYFIQCLRDLKAKELQAPMTCPRCSTKSLFIGTHLNHGDLFCCPKCEIIDSEGINGALIWHYASSRLWEDEELERPIENVKVIMDRQILWRKLNA